MKLKNIFSFALLFVAALLMQSCSDSDNVAATGLTVTKDDAAVTSLEFAIGEGSAMLGVNTNADWSVSVSDEAKEWLSVTPTEGYGWNISDSTASNYRSYFKVMVTKNDDAPRTGTITVNAGGLTSTITVNQKGIEADGHESAVAMVENFKLGYNMGNNLESTPYGSWWNPENKTPKDWETAWGQPEITSATIDALKAKGINVIRIPVTWYPHIPHFNKTYTGNDADYTIDAAWMARVKEVVDMVHDAGMYCILNVQHDSGANNKSGDPNSAWLHAGDDYDNVTKIYQAIWKQIANEFKDYDDKLIFESFNEILNNNSSWTAPAAGDVAYQSIAKLQQDFVNVVRTSGGNNTYRNLLVSTYADGTTQVVLDEFQLPTDPSANHLCATFHSYDPYWFCNGNNADVEIKPSDSEEVKKQKEQQKSYYINVFGADQKAEIDAIFDRVSKRCNALGVPYFFGEFGAIGDHPGMEERAKYATYFMQRCNENKTAGLWWSGLLDRSTQTWTEEDIIDALAAARK